MNPKPYVRHAFRKYLECGIFAHGFARAWCDDCGHDYFVAYSCKGRGVCPSCNTRRMVETAAQVNKAALHIGAIALAKPQVHIHRFGSSLNGHVHLHVCAVDGVFEEVAGGADAQSSPQGIAFHPASGIDATAVAQVQTDLRRPICADAFGAPSWAGACCRVVSPKRCWPTRTAAPRRTPGVRIEADDRAALQRLLRYCACPPFALDRPGRPYCGRSEGF